MITKVGRRRRSVRFAIGIASGMLVASGATGLAVYAATGHTGTGHTGTGQTGTGLTDAAHTGAGHTGAGTAAPPVQLADGKKTTVAAPTGVPWRQVGPGWELVEYTTRTQAQHGPTTLYLIGPSGARYALYTWRASSTWAPSLIDWSGDKRRALLTGVPGQYEQLTLATGAVSHIQLAGGATPIGYTRPSGLNILGSTSSGSTTTIARYSLTGKLVKVLAHGSGATSAIYSADGARIAVSGVGGLQMVSNGGSVTGSLPVPGSGAAIRCYPVRWWDASTILAYCDTPGTTVPRLWLVPAGGARPVPLSPQRDANSGDLGDIGAWPLPSGLYLQSLVGCSAVNIVKQAADGSTTPVAVPNTTGNDNYVATALGSRLLVEAETDCEGSHSLLWFDPVTHAEQWLLRAPANALGVTAVVPYYTKENSPSP